LNQKGRNEIVTRGRKEQPAFIRGKGAGRGRKKNHANSVLVCLKGLYGQWTGRSLVKRPVNNVVGSKRSTQKGWRGYQRGRDRAKIKTPSSSKEELVRRDSKGGGASSPERRVIGIAEKGDEKVRIQALW